MSPKATILVVDDEPDVREVLEEYFVAHGYAVVAAESAGVARAMAAQHPIDLALVDITMPGEIEPWHRDLAAIVAEGLRRCHHTERMADVS